jgi:WD40 repeat protein
MQSSANWVGLVVILHLGKIVSVGADTVDTVTQPVDVFGLGDLKSVAISMDGRHVATAGRSGAYLWDLEEGTVRHRFEGEGGNTPALVFSPDSRVLLSAGDSRVIRAWDVESGKLLRDFFGHQGEIQDLEFAPDGGAFVSASADNTARVWSLETGETLNRVTVPGAMMQAAAFTPDGARLITAATAASDRIRLWDLATETTIRTFADHAWHVPDLGFVRSGHLVTAGEDSVVRVWDVDTGELVRTLTWASQSVVGMVVAPDSRTVIVGGGDGRIMAWNAETGEVLGELQGEPSSAIRGIATVGWVITANVDNTARLLDLTSGETLLDFVGHCTSTTRGVDFSPDGLTVLSGGAETSTRLWNRSDGTLQRTFDGQGAGTAAAAFSSDGKLVLTTRGHPQPMVQLWDTETGEIQHEFGWANGWPTSAALSHDGARVVAGDQNGRVRLWNVIAGAQPRVFTGQAAIITAVAISPDGQRFASGGSSYRSAVNLWDAGTGETRHTFELDAGSVTALDFSPSGNELVVAWEDGYLRIFDVLTGGLDREIVTPAGYLNDAKFSPDGHYILVGEGWPFYTARLYDALSGQQLRVFAGHKWSVESVAFDPTGTAILTGSDVVRLWDMTDVAARLRTRRWAGGLELSWNLGALQQAPALRGPWEDVIEAASPWTIPAEGSGTFFRVKVP